MSLAVRHSRRAVLVAAPLAAGFVAHQAPAQAWQGATPAATTEWSFVDDLGVTITRPERPTRVAAYINIGAALQDFGITPIAIFGVARRDDGSPEIYAGSLDLDTIPNFGETYGELNVEQLVMLKPELLVTDLWGDSMDLWGLDESTVEQVEHVVPIVNIGFVQKPVSETISRIEDLAAALGADLEAPAVREAKASFDEASTALTAALAEKPGLRVLFASATLTELYVANPNENSDLMYFRDLGMEIVTPDAAPGEFFITVSWEQANQFPADLIVLDGRAVATAQPEQLAAIAAWTALPAVQADQIGVWSSEYVPSYKTFADILENLTADVRAAKTGIAPS